MPTNPHPTARALVEAFVAESERQLKWTMFAPGSVIGLVLERHVALALAAAHAAGRREGREEMRAEADALLERSERANLRWRENHGDEEPGGMRTTEVMEFQLRSLRLALSKLPLDDAARGEEKGKK